MLSELGFSPNESTVYTFVLNNPDLTASQIAKKCMLDKSSTYRACDDLVKKNVFVTSPIRKGVVFRALSPLVLFELINKQESELKRKREIVEQIVKSVNFENSVQTQITVEYGEDALEKWMNISLDSKDKNIYQLLHKYSNLYRSDRHKEFNKKYVTKRNQLGIKIYLLEDIAPNMSITLEKSKINELKEIRIIPNELDFKHSLILFDNTSVIQTFTDSGEIVVTSINDVHTSEMFRGIFNFIWEKSEKI